MIHSFDLHCVLIDEQQVDINKGVTEMQATKRLILDGLKRIQQPDEPEWLQQLKAMPEEEPTKVELSYLSCCSSINLIYQFKAGKSRYPT